ncbi:MAG: glycoside hydrolase family 11 protein [Clostridiales bacterium]|nr:glycoside hydrolase family 11 protein [Clostridiales bacterium]
MMDKNATLKGSFFANGSIYDIYECTRINRPSIVGNTTFQQHFSIRRDTKSDGTIDITEHFNKWESFCLTRKSAVKSKVIFMTAAKNPTLVDYIVFEFLWLKIFGGNTNKHT